jgi:hypothetical protein
MAKISGTKLKDNLPGAVDGQPVEIRAAFLAEKADVLLALHKTVASSVVEIGRHLSEVKATFGRGDNPEFLTWAHQALGWKKSSVYSFINVYELISTDKFSNDLEKFDPSSLYLLAATTTPAEVVETVAERSSKGERFSRGEIKTMIAEAKTANSVRNNYAPTSSKPKSAKPVRDPIDTIVDKIRGPLCDGNKWRAKHVIATTLKVAPTAVQQALDTLEEGKDYVTRARGDVIEFQFKRIEVADAKDSRITELEALIVERDAEIAGLKDQIADLKAKLADQAEIAAPSPAMIH